MQDWVFDIAAVAGCCLGFVVLFSILRVLMLLVKITALSAIVVFAIRSYQPQLSLPSISPGALVSLVSATGAAAGRLEDLVGDASEVQSRATTAGNPQPKHPAAAHPRR